MESNIDFSTFDAFLEFLINSPVVPPKLAENSIHTLIFFKAILTDRPEELVEDGSLQEIEFVVGKLESFFFSFDLSKMNQYMALELCLQLNDFCRLNENMLGLQGINGERPMLPPSYYSTTTPFVFIKHLMEILEELQKDTSSSTRPFNYFILNVQRELHFWYSDLIEISTNPPLFLKELIQTISNLAYDVEYALDLFLVGDVPSWLCICWLTDIYMQFQEIEQERSDGEDEEEDLNTKKPLINDMLLGGDKQLDLITIVGSSGIGKSAFAKELYNSPSVIDNFDTRAYCCFDSFSDSTRQLLEILDDLINLSDIIRSKNYEELTKLVYECLEGQKFLVVIDNVRYINDWISIRKCFPDSHNGSRIVFTTENRDFALSDDFKSIEQIQSRHSDKMWEALFQKVSFPHEMFEVGMKIAKRCKPESMTRILLLLQTLRKTVNQWEEIANTLGSRVFGRAGSQEKRVLDLTCIYLSDHLRSCFFYTGVFLEKREIIVSKLIQLWIAEGYIKHTTSQSLENTGEDYVADLISRNLLVPTKEKTLGKVKTCVLAPVVLDFLSSKVIDDNFLQIENYSRYHDFSSYSSSTIYQQHRLVIGSQWNKFVMLEPSGKIVRSLFFLPIYKDSGDIPFIYNKFKLLKILNFEHLVIGDSFIEIGVLVLLKYLAVQSSVDFIPPSISNLWNLETFIFKKSNDEVVKVPDCIWEMSKLRHVHIQSNPSFDLETRRLENLSSILHNLQTFSKPTLAYGDDMEKLLRKLPTILKLSCVFLDSWDDNTKCNHFPVLKFLHLLISLKVEYKGKRKYPCEFNFPLNLKKLTLLRFRMPWNEISQLTILNNLEVLKLIDDAFEGERWEMEDHVVFPKLKYLKLRKMKVVEYWNATHDQFPHLEHLVMDQCEKLIEIPQDFAHISTLRMIEVMYCTSSAENSVRLIQEQHMKRWGHGELTISYRYNFS